ncbi:hypothetical protein P4544_11005 [Halomonas sp. LY9]
MPIFELFSKRQKKLRGEVPDIYQYEILEQSFRVQVVHIIRDTIGVEQSYNNATNRVYEEIHRVLCKEYGVFSLKEYSNSNFEAVFEYFLKEKNMKNASTSLNLHFELLIHMCVGESGIFIMQQVYPKSRMMQLMS